MRVPQYQSVTGSAHIHLGWKSETAGSSIEPSVNRGGFVVPWPPTLGASGTNQQRSAVSSDGFRACATRHLDPPSRLLTRSRTGIGSCQDRPMAQSEPEPQESQLGDAVLDAMRGALRILGGMVQMAAGMTRLLAVAVLKAATAAEKAVEASEKDEETWEPKPTPKPRTRRPAKRGS